jgi:hypothetical protein
MAILTFIRRLFCQHREFDFVRNIYGDEINHCGGKRSLWRCKGCGSAVLHARLHPDPAPAAVEPGGAWPRA